MRRGVGQTSPDGNQGACVRSGRDQHGVVLGNAQGEVVVEGLDDLGLPRCGLHRRVVHAGNGLLVFFPLADVPEDLLDDRRVLNARDDARLILTLRAGRRIDFVHLANQSRPTLPSPPGPFIVFSRPDDLGLRGRVGLLPLYPWPVAVSTVVDNLSLPWVGNLRAEFRREV